MCAGLWATIPVVRKNHKQAHELTVKTCRPERTRISVIRLPKSINSHKFNADDVFSKDTLLDSAVKP